MVGFMLWILRFILVQTAIAASGYEADLFQNGNGDLSWEGSNAPLVAALQQQVADTPSEYKTPAAHGLQGSASSPEDTMKKLRSIYKENIRSKVETSDHCAGRDIIVRKEWGDMGRDERLDYLRAVKCMARKPSRTPPDFAPGARTRWDDFVVAHIINQPFVHRSPVLLSWHREFTFQLERALRDECGYKHGHPYWDYGRYIGQDISTWPVFDGSETSISGNGVKSGPSCACLPSGPLKDFPVNVGPVGKNVACSNNSRDDGLAYNHRCIERLFDHEMLSNLTYDKMTTTILEYKTSSRLDCTWKHGRVAYIQLHMYLSRELRSILLALQGIRGSSIITAGWTFSGRFGSLDFTSRKYALANSSDYDSMRNADNVKEKLPNYELDTALSFSPWLENATLWQVLNPLSERYCIVYE